MKKGLITLTVAAFVLAFSVSADAKFKFANFSNNFEQAAAAGFDGVQLNHGRKNVENFGGYSKKEIADLKEKMKKTGLQICSICVPCYHKFIFEEDPNAVSYIKNIIDQTKELGADDILIPFFGKSSLYEKEQVNGKFVFKKARIAPLVARLKELAVYAEKKGVTLSLENTITPDDNIWLVEQVGSPNVRVFFDTLNVETQAKVPAIDAIKKLGKKYMHQIHLKANAEFFEEASKPVNIDGVFQAIVDSGYDGWLVLENGCKIKNHTPDEVYSHNVKFFKSSVLGK